MLLPYYLLAAAATVMASPTVYLIRHGEKPDDGGNGLSAQGVQRAQCLRSVFGKDSKYNIGYIMAQTPKKSMFDIKRRVVPDVFRIANRLLQAASGPVPMRRFFPWLRTWVLLWILLAIATTPSV